MTIDWPYPFAEGRLFVLTVSAGLEGYHVNVDGRHVTSFPYRTVSIVFGISWNCAKLKLRTLKVSVMLSGICS